MSALMDLVRQRKLCAVSAESAVSQIPALSAQTAQAIPRPVASETPTKSGTLGDTALTALTAQAFSQKHYPDDVETGPMPNDGYGWSGLLIRYLRRRMARGDADAAAELAALMKYYGECDRGEHSWPPPLKPPA